MFRLFCVYIIELKFSIQVKNKLTAGLLNSLQMLFQDESPLAHLSCKSIEFYRAPLLHYEALLQVRSPRHLPESFITDEQLGMPPGAVAARVGAGGGVVLH